MGYVNVTLLPEQSARIARAIPYLATHAMELRQWTIRRLVPPRKQSEAADPTEGEQSRPPQGGVEWFEDLISDDCDRGNERGMRDTEWRTGFQWGGDE
jgi:hypothetical protein